jgi:hypothetical protein
LKAYRTPAGLVSIYRDLGASVGLQLVSALVVFVEGKEADSDKRILDRLVGASIPAANFITGGDCDGLLSVGSRANKLLEDSSTNGDFLARVDRDYREDAEVDRVQKQYRSRVFLWNVHEIENLFLSPGIVYETLRLHDQLGNLEDEQDVADAFREVARELRSWIAADWVRWDIDQGLKHPSGWIAPPDPLKSLQEYGQRVREGAQQAGAVTDIDKRYAETLAEIDRFLACDKWLLRLPGKQLLRRLLSKHTRLSNTECLPTAVSAVLDKGIPIPEIDRRKQTLQQCIGRNAGKTGGG